MENQKQVNQQSCNATFVAILRIVIGWHFLYEGVWKLMQKGEWSCASYLTAAQGPLAPLFKWMSAQGWIVVLGDWAVQLGLVAIGLALVTGILARVAALFGIALMAMFYCCQPPEPFATAFSGADGRFFVLERNAIEALGLLLIAVLPCWHGFLRTLLPGGIVLMLFGGCVWMQYRAGGFKKVEAVTSATVKVHEFTALAALTAPFAEKTNLGGAEISRLALGGDLIAGHAHARDLIWTDDFMRRYNSGATLPRTVRYCLHCGIDTVFVEPKFIAPMLAEAGRALASASDGVRGAPALPVSTGDGALPASASDGRAGAPRTPPRELKIFANCANAKDAALAAQDGAKGVYLRPEMADAFAKRGDGAGLKAVFAALRDTKLPVGVGAEDVATVKFCVENGIAPDFWLLAYHSLDYPAATMETKCNNIWCADPVAAAAYMKSRPEPWVAIRGLAGGAIDPAKAYKFAVDGGAAVVAIDLLDYRIVETVNGIVKGKKGVKGEKGVKEVAK